MLHSFICKHYLIFELASFFRDLELSECGHEKKVMSKSGASFGIVGVGASAGGIESFKRLLSRLRPNSGMAYVFLQHLEPSHESHLSEILSRNTDLPVREITNGMQIVPDAIFTLPSNKTVTASEDLRFRLEPRDSQVQNLPIDIFFTSIGENYKSLAIGVVLSGSGSDGTMGLKNIRQHGGVTFAELPGTASWADMPQNAIDTGIVDFVLPSEEIADKILSLKGIYQNKDFWEGEKLSGNEEDAYRQILSLVRLNSGIDFTYYKQATLKRRLIRRMAIAHMTSFQDYLKHLRNNTNEQETLLQDMLIQVTSFFRDSRTFQELSEKVFPNMLENLTKEGNVRMWIPGCATGEEAYSLAICFHEALENVDPKLALNIKKIQIFASDVSEVAIEKARSGVYNKSEVQAVSDVRLKTYFTRINSDYKVNKTIRDSIVFATHNFLKDPPFAKMDLISCRNVFIYLEPYLQKKALTTFHYALKNNGFLVLGKAETSGGASNLYVPFSTQERIYIRKKGQGSFIISPVTDPKTNQQKTEMKSPSLVPRPDFKKSAESLLIADHTPPSVIVDEHMEVVHFNGVLVPFLEPPSGKPTFNLMKMAQEGLGFELRNAIHRANTAQTRFCKEDIPIKSEGGRILASIEVIPLKDTVEPYYLILFYKKTVMSGPFKKLLKKWNSFWTNIGNNSMELEIKALRNELVQAREDMRAITEVQEATNEELQSSNEELLSSNEEMQTLNEELETSKEELQSTNEELIIINQELIEKQTQLNDFLHYNEAILSTIRESLVVLDKKLHVRSANRSFFEKFGVREKEIVGKPFFEIQEGKWHSEDLETMLEKVLPKKESLVDFEINLDIDLDGKLQLELNAREVIDGKKADNLILLAIEDITERNKAIENYQTSIKALKQTNRQLDQFVHVASHDLQEPLRKILTFSNRLRTKGQKLLSDNLMTYLEKIESSSKRMSTLIQDLLDYSQVSDHEKMFEPTDLNMIIAELLPDFELVIENSEGKIDVQPLPKIIGIPMQLKQLFYNLISNSFKYAKKDVKPNIKITSKELTSPEVASHSTLDTNKRYIEIIVQDNGIGFDQKYGEQIFTIFQRLNTSGEYKGTGIGLALAKRVVENHNGKIFAKSELGEGTDFHIVLPMENA